MHARTAVGPQSADILGSSQALPAVQALNRSSDAITSARTWLPWLSCWICKEQLERKMPMKNGGRGLLAPLFRTDADRVRDRRARAEKKGINLKPSWKPPINVDKGVLMHRNPIFQRERGPTGRLFANVEEKDKTQRKREDRRLERARRNNFLTAESLQAERQRLERERAKRDAYYKKQALIARLSRRHRRGLISDEAYEEYMTELQGLSATSSGGEQTLTSQNARNQSLKDPPLRDPRSGAGSKILGLDWAPRVNVVQGTIRRRTPEADRKLGLFSRWRRTETEKLEDRRDKASRRAQNPWLIERVNFVDGVLRRRALHKERPPRPLTRIPTTNTPRSVQHSVEARNSSDVTARTVQLTGPPIRNSPEHSRERGTALAAGAQTGSLRSVVSTVSSLSESDIVRLSSNPSIVSRQSLPGPISKVDEFSPGNQQPTGVRDPEDSAAATMSGPPHEARESRFKENFDHQAPQGEFGSRPPPADSSMAFSACAYFKDKWGRGVPWSNTWRHASGRAR